MPNTEWPIPKHTRQTVKAVSAQKASATDCGQDSSDDDLSASTSNMQPGPFWTSVSEAGTFGLKLGTSQSQRARPVPSQP